MGSLSAIREQRRLMRLDQLRQGAQMALTGRPGAEVWLFGSLARGDWDAYSDVDLLAVAPSETGADELSDALLDAQLADDVIALTTNRWRQLRDGDDPHWRAIGRDALRLNQP